MFDEFFTPEQLLEIDRFDQVQLAEAQCAGNRSPLSEAGRALFAPSRARRKATNDSDQGLQIPREIRFGLGFPTIKYPKIDLVEFDPISYFHFP